MQDRLKLEFSLLLPEIDSEQDKCVLRLIESLALHKGIDHVHVSQQDGDAVLCLHFDSNLLSVDEVRRWAERAGAEIKDRYRVESLRLTGMDCGDCAASIEHILDRLPGVLSVSVSYAGERLRIEYDSTETNHNEIARRIRWMGYRIEEQDSPSWLVQNQEMLMAVLAGLFLVFGLISQSVWHLPRAVSIALYICSYLAGGHHAAHHGLKAALKWRFDVDLLMVIAALGAAAIGKWPEGALLLFLFSLGHALEHYAMNRARSAIAALGKITPKTARVRRDGQEMEISVERLERGDRVIVRPDERIPVDGEVVSGASEVDQSTLTGESVPVAKEEGDDVYAGTLNGHDALEVNVTKLAHDTALARVVELVEQAQTRKSPTQRFTERFESRFVPLVLAGVLAVILLPPLFGWLSWSESFLRAMTILVAASPCALAIATPSAILAGIAQAARNGVLVKGGVHLEVLGALDAIAFDKTGTITTGTPRVTDLIAYESSEQQLLRYAAAAESRSMHPLARAVVQAADKHGIDYPDAHALKSIVGRGVQAEVEGAVVRVGAISMFQESPGPPLPVDVLNAAEAIQKDGKTVMLVQRGSQLLGVIGLADRPRPEAASTIDQLKSIGITSIVMLTGDNNRVARSIANEVGVTQYQAELMPSEKVDAVHQLLKQYGQVAMVGDGVNDAPALKTASVGIAMGATGSDVALETADVALMADDLTRLPFAVALSRQTRRIIGQNLVIALGVIAALVPCSLFGWAGIGIAILFHEGSTLVVVANALRLLRFRSTAGQNL